MNDSTFFLNNENPSVSKDQIQAAIAEIRNYFPDDENLQKISDDQLFEKVHEFIHSDQIMSVQLPEEFPAISLRDDLFDSCPYAIALIVVDFIFMFLGFCGLHISNPSRVIEALGKAAEKIIEIIAKDPNKWKQLIIKIVLSKTPNERAVAIYALIKEAYNAKLFKVVFDAIKGLMKPIDYVISIIAAIAQIAALALTDGAAFVAEIILNITSIEHLIEDSIKAIDKCKQ